MNFCNCPNCQTDNCPNADRESGLAECVEAMKAAAHDMEEILIGIDGLDGDINELKRLHNLCQGRLLVLKGTIRNLNPNASVKQVFEKGRWT